jgi:ribosome-associated protein
VVHIFRKDKRDYFALEKLWGDAEFIDIENPVITS